MHLHLINGNIYCGAGRFARSLTIRDGIITAVDMPPEAGAAVHDLEGRTVLPGLNDSHMHLIQTGFAMNAVDLSQAGSVEESLQMVSDWLEAHPGTQVLSGRGWNHDRFLEPRFIDKNDLDAVSVDFPMILNRACGNITALNSAAIRALGITEDTVIPGGDFQRDEKGACNGVLFGDAVSWAENRLLQASEQAVAEAALRAANDAVSKGITSVQSNDAWNENSDAMFAMLHKLVPGLPLRYSVQFGQQNVEDLRRYFETEFQNPNDYNERRFRRGSLKLFKDGALGVRTAEIDGGYADDPRNSGFERITRDEHLALTALANAHGVTVVTHAIGDHAIRTVAENYRRVNGGPKNPLRHAIIHCQITTPELLDLIEENEIAVMHQPNFLDYDLQIAAARVGQEKAKSSYAYGTMIQRGIPVSLGSDAPVEDCNPFRGLQSAVTHARLNGEPEGGYNPDARCTVEEAVDAYTAGSAWQEGTESFKGLLAENYVADLIVLDRDIFTVDPQEIQHIQVLRTMVDGEWVYQK